MNRTALIVFLILVAGSLGVPADAGDGSLHTDWMLERLHGFWEALYGETSTAPGVKASPYAMEVLAKASPDECFLGPGEENLYPFDFEFEECTDGKPKVNESYVFGLTRAGDDLWFGSAPNMGCLVYGTISEQGIPGGLKAFESDLWTCEYGEGLFGQGQELPPYVADWRPPSIYVYDTEGRTLEKKEIDDPLLWETLGLRSAGALGDVVLLAGPIVTAVGGPVEAGGINVFAFNAATGDYLGSRHLEAYNDIRKWIDVDGVLYTGVANNRALFPEPDEAPFGAVLRWTGDLDDPFSFETVGWLDGEAVEFAAHEGRLFTTTWPDFGKLLEEAYDPAGLWMSPILGPDGLHAEDAGEWQKVWSSCDYERDEVAARMYNGGALASFDGYLYWGTTHAPLSAGFAHAQAYGFYDPENPDEIDILGMMKAIFGAHRPVSIFRGRDFGTPGEAMEVVYGLPWMPAYIENPFPFGPERFWWVLPNRMGPPVGGFAGFGNWYNTYTWTMDVYGDELFVGTMDWSHMFSAIMVPYLADPVPIPEFEMPKADHGGDLYVIRQGSPVASMVSSDGAGNYGSYGFRTMIAGDGLYLGMANAMNMMTDPEDCSPEGGWELLRLEKREGTGESISGRRMNRRVR